LNAAIPAAHTVPPGVVVTVTIGLTSVPIDTIRCVPC
jgi:hypothetical protein